MKDSVIIFVSDDNYIDHVKSLAVNCKLQGNWDGDYAVICPSGSRAANEFRQTGFDVLETNFSGFMQKFDVFNKFFKKWSKALYLDCDIIIQDDLQRLFVLLDNGDLWMDTEDGKIIDMFWRDDQKEANRPVYEWMSQNYPHVDTCQTFNSAFILFKPESIDETIPSQLSELQDKIHPINSPYKLGTDQQPINVLMWHQIKKIPNKLCCFWGHAEPSNDVVSDWRGWVGGEVPVGIHYTRWYAQWNYKTPNADAYKVHKLDKPAFEIYHDNLKKFDEVFPHA